MACRFAADLERDGITRDIAVKTGQASNERFTRAPVLIVAFLDPTVLDRYPDGARAGIEHLMGVQGVSACCTTLLLALHAAGLHACWYCAPLFAPGTFHEILNVPSSWEPQAFITTGHGTPGPDPDDARGDGRQLGTTRMPIDEVSFTAGHFLDEHRKDGGTP